MAGRRLTSLPPLVEQRRPLIRSRVSIDPARGWSLGSLAPGHHRLLLLAALLSLLGLPGVATTDEPPEPDFVLCVTDVVPPPDAHCWGNPCDELLDDVPAALDWAVQLPDLDGQRPRVRICTGAELEDSGTPYIGSLIIDNRGGVYGEPLELILRRPMCPSPSSGPSQAVIEVVTDGEVELVGPITDMSACEAGARPGINFWGGGGLNMYDAVIDGWTGYAVANGLAATPGRLDLGFSALANGSGAAIWSSGFVNLVGLEIAGNRTAGAEALVSSSSHFKLSDSVLYGNLVDGESSRALVQGRGVEATNSSFLANGLVGGRPVVRTTLVRTYYPGGESANWGDSLENVVFARNSSVSSGDGLDLHVDPSPVSGDEPSCVGEPPEPYWSRPDPFAGLPHGEPAPLIRTIPTSAGEEPNGVLRLARSWLLDNRMGPGAALVEVEGLAAGESVLLANNTVAGNEETSTVLSLSGGAGAAVLLRNLFVGDAGTFSVLDFVEAPDSIVLSMNAAPQDVRWGPDTSDVEHLVEGPFLTFEDPSFEAAEALRGLPTCGRHLATCPDVTTSDCWATPGTLLECLPDVAATYVPTPGFSQAISAPWPWTTDFFGDIDVPVAGACAFGYAA